MPRRQWRLLVADIIAAIEAVDAFTAFTAGFTQEQFFADRLHLDAVRSRVMRRC